MLFFLCILILPPISPVSAVEETPPNEALALGEAGSVDGNVARARERAISRALEKGVEQVLLARLGGDGAVNNYERIVRDIMPAARELIQNYHVLSERETGTGYGVLIRVRVNERLLEQRMKAAGVVVLEGPAVRLLFLVSEHDAGVRYWWQDPDAGAPLSPVELALFREFQERGFAPVNRTLGSPETPGGGEWHAADLPPEAVRMWGRLFSAEVVVFGRAERLAENRAFMKLAAMEVETGRVLAEAERMEPVTESWGETAAALARALAGEIAPAVLGAVGAERNRPRQLSVTITGLRSYQQFASFKSFLETAVSGVESVVQTRMRRSAVTIAVSFMGSRAAFLDRVMNHEALPLRLQETHAQGNVIVLNVMPEQEADAADR